MKLLTLKITVFTILLLSLTVLGCENSRTKDGYHVPEKTDDGLQVASAEDFGIDIDYLEAAAKKISGGKFGEVHSLLVCKNNTLVFEEYFQGHKYQWDAPGHKGEWVTWNREMQHCIHSDTKSITSLCIGIAIDKGFIENAHQSIFDYLPDYQHLKINNKKYITIEHLLTMTSGLRWEEWGVSLGSINNDQIGIWFWEDGPMNYVLSREFVAEPGKRFNYSGGDIQILVEILKNATGMTLDEFSEKYLFEPLGIASYDWWLKFPSSGDIQGAGGLKLTPRDMVKIGSMMLNRGMWNGQRIVSEEWVDKCGIPFAGNYDIKIPGEDMGAVGYGFTWWTKQYADFGPMFCALGWGGQKIMIFPELDAVVVFTGANYNSKVKQNKILGKYVLPAIKQITKN